MGLTTLRIGAIVSVLAASIALAVTWRESRVPIRPENAPRHDDWVRTKDGWQRPDWKTANHQPPLHPGLVAAFMALASLAFLVAASPSEEAVENQDQAGQSPERKAVENFLTGSAPAAPNWSPRVVSCEETV